VAEMRALILSEVDILSAMTNFPNAEKLVIA